MKEVHLNLGSFNVRGYRSRKPMVDALMDSQNLHVVFRKDNLMQHNNRLLTGYQCETVGRT